MENEATAPARRLEPASLALTARTLRADGKSLAFEYQLTNKSDGPVYVFTPLSAADKTGTPAADPNLVYAFVRNGDIVEFQKALLQLPPWAVVEAPEVPFLTRLDKGATLKEEVTVALPLRVHDPYDENYPNGERRPIKTAAGWKLTIGALADDPQQPVVRPVTVGGKKLLTIGYEDAFKRQVQVTTDVQPVKLAVLEPARTLEKEFLKQAQ
ncbi:MAG TPA: hypothetical protein VF310_17360 [Vicinamibacteria bacterium]